MNRFLEKFLNIFSILVHACDEGIRMTKFTRIHSHEWPISRSIKAGCIKFLIDCYVDFQQPIGLIKYLNDRKATLKEHVFIILTQIFVHFLIYCTIPYRHPIPSQLSSLFLLVWKFLVSNRDDKVHIRFNC